MPEDLSIKDSYKAKDESEKKNEFSDYDVNGDGVIVMDEFQASVK